MTSFSFLGSITSREVMEINAIIIGAGIFVLCAVVIYLISAVTMREKTYEEVMEEQRQKHAEFTMKSKQDKKEKKNKKKVFP